MTQNQQRELPSNHLAATLTSRQIQHYRMTRDLAELEKAMGRLEVAIMTARDVERQVGASMDAAPAPSPVAQQAADSDPTRIDSGYARELHAAAPPTPKPSPTPTPKPKPDTKPQKPKRVRNKGPSFTASGKRRGRPVGSVNKPKPTVVPEREAHAAADQVDDMTPQQRSAAETIHAARMATGG